MNLKNIVVGLITTMVVGCSGVSEIKPQRYYIVKDIGIIVLSKEDMIRENLIRHIVPPKKCFYDTNIDILFIPYSDVKGVDNNYLPDFHCLGHELWHNKGLGGNYHK